MVNGKVGRPDLFDKAFIEYLISKCDN
jgi:hypothetical protein